MLIYSMTGFGKGEAINDSYVITTEIKTVNNRFRDFKFRMSSLFNPLEIEFRAMLEKEFKRGSFDVSINYKKNEKHRLDFQIDPAKVEAYIELLRPVFAAKGINFNLSPVEFLRSDFFREEDVDKNTDMYGLARSSFEIAISELKKSRASEGGKLVTNLLEHLGVYEKCLAEVESLKKIYPEMVKDKLLQKLSEKIQGLKLDESRMMQEVIFYLEKLEIDEEINRAKIHMVKLKKLLASPGEVGRQIDFLLQELGRETNTIGSKSGHAEISSNVIEMKVQLEKIREQALNLE
jgi:uncharacterized protein (TIGR00255 family)